MRYVIVVFSLFVLMVTKPAAGGASFVTTASDPRFILQTQAGLAAHITTDPLSLDYVRPLFSEIDIDTNDYLVGHYTLSGRTAKVGLAIGRDGWVITYHDRETHVGQLFDCHGNDVSKSRVEWALEEVAQALEIEEPMISHYDFRDVEANAVVLHWLYIANSGSDQSTINLPLGNNYMERGYAFCTALTNSRFRLNGELIDQQGSVSSVIRRWGVLGSGQLRAGQTNSLEIEASSFFGTGFVGGVAVSYRGMSPIMTDGGNRRDLNLIFPLLLGEPLTIHQSYLPAVVNE